MANLSVPLTVAGVEGRLRSQVMILLEAEPHGLTAEQLLPTIQAVDPDVSTTRLSNAIAQLADVDWITTPGLAGPFVDGGAIRREWNDRGRGTLVLGRVWTATPMGLRSRPAVRIVGAPTETLDFAGVVGSTPHLPPPVGIVRDRPDPVLTESLDIGEQ